MADEGGRWVTINGAAVFIKDGQSAGDAIKARFGGSKPYNKKASIGDTVITPKGKGKVEGWAGPLVRQPGQSKKAHSASVKVRVRLPSGEVVIVDKADLKMPAGFRAQREN